MSRGSLLLLPVLSLGCGVSSLQVRELPPYREAMALPGPEQPKLFYLESIDLQRFPAVTPYAVVTVVGGGKESAARAIGRKATELKADVVLVEEGFPAYVGAIGVYYGFGISSSQPVYQRIHTGLCLRVNRARLGFQTDKEAMVVSIDPASKETAGGLLEGDTVLSVNSAGWGKGDDPLRFTRYAALLKLQPGDKARLIWFRSGTGRMEGEVTALANTAEHLALPEPFAWKVSRRSKK